MNNQTNTWFLLGAAVVGIVSAAGVFLIEQFRQDKRRHAFTQDLARLDGQLSSLKKELDVLRQLQKEKLNNSLTKPSRRKLRNSSALSVTSTEDYSSAVDIDSSDLEFYDLSSEEESERSPLEKELRELDKLLDSENDFDSALQRIEELNKTYPRNADILWRLGKGLKIKATYTKDDEERKQMINRGIESCEIATELRPTSALCHKWMAILVGQRAQFQPTKERIIDGHLFKKHIDASLEITPNDPYLHHLLGRFTYEVAKLSWIEKTLASTLFAELPQCTYEDALKSFLEAEKLNEKDWKENRLYIAKCELAIGKTDSAIEWLNKAENASSSTNEEEKVHEEVMSLLEKFNKQR